MALLPSGNDTSAGPVSNSSQSPLPGTASQLATSDRLSSTSLSTSSALRTMIESFPSTITVLSPVVVTLGTAAAAENAADGAGAPALRAVSERLSAPVVLFEQPASTSAGASASDVRFFILPPRGIGGGACVANSQRRMGKGYADRP